MTANRISLSARWILVVALAGCVPILFAQDQPKQADALTYFPLAVGNTWRYVNSVGGESVTQVVRQEKVRDEMGYRLETSVGNRVVSWEVLAVRSDGIYRLAANDVPLNPPILVLKNPPNPKESWSFQTRVKDRTLQGKLTVQPTLEEVITRAGKYSCLKVTSESLELDKQKVALTTWYAPKVGPVKVSVKLGEQETTLELVEFKPGVSDSSKPQPEDKKPDKAKTK